jgi:transposase
MHTGTTKRKYTREFRESAVRLVTVEKVPAAKAAADLGIPVNTLSVWVSQARNGKGSFTPPGGVDWEKKARELEAENRRLRIERDILKKATAFFAKEEGGRP